MSTRPREPAVRRPTPLLVVAGLLLAALLAACTDESGPTPDAASPSPDVAAAASPSPMPSAAPPSAPPSPSAPDVDTTITACDDERRATLVAVVDGQLAAIAARDWPAAHGYATTGFRDVIDLDRFQEIITEGFPVVAANRARDIGRCRTRGDEAALEVTVQDGDGTQQALVYRFEREPDGWAIGGASPVGSDGEPTDEPGITA